MMRTLLLNPPSFENFDGGASSRWPASREIASFWYPVWLAYPAAMIPESRLLDAPPHGVSVEETVQIARDFEQVVVFTSTPSFVNDARLAEEIKKANPSAVITFVGPHVTVKPAQSLNASPAIDVVVRKEFDYAVKEIAEGRKWDEIEGINFRRDGEVAATPDRKPIENLDALPWAAPIYKRDLDFTKYNVPFLLNPYVSFYTERGCPAQCTFCLWPQTFSGHAWRTRNEADVAAEAKWTVENFPGLKEIFFDDDTFTIRKSRVLDLCEKFKPIDFTWSCTSRVTVDLETLKGMRAAGCRLLIVGFESGDNQILKNIKKGTTVDQAREFAKNCKKAGILIHGDFILGLPGETKETIQNTIKFACELDCETIQVSIGHPYPGTGFMNYLENNDLIPTGDLVDAQGHQLSNINYPGLSSLEIYEAIETFYKKYYYRPRIVARILSKAVVNGEERRRLHKEAREWFQWLNHRREHVVEMKRAEALASE